MFIVLGCCVPYLVCIEFVPVGTTVEERGRADGGDVEECA